MGQVKLTGESGVAVERVSVAHSVACGCCHERKASIRLRDRRANLSDYYCRPCIVTLARDLNAMLAQKENAA